MKEKLEIIWFYIMCILGLVFAPFIFVWAAVMYATGDFESLDQIHKRLQNEKKNNP